MIFLNAPPTRRIFPIALAALLAVAAWEPAMSAPPPMPEGASQPVVSGAQARDGVIPFGPGEAFRFGVKFGFVRAGDAELAVEGSEMVDGEMAYRLVSTAESSRFFSTFFPVNDRVISTWSARRRIPLRFEKHIREGKYAKDEIVRFDHAREEAVYPDGKRVPIVPGTQDVLSAFYLVRTLALNPGDVVGIPNHTDGKNHPLQVRVLRRETVEVPAGTFRCIVVEPLLKSAGLFKQEGSLTIWLTDDARRMPVLMKSKVAVGSIVAELETFRMGRLVPDNLGGARTDDAQAHRP